jgi:uncharacterized Fe-S cluster protein YjdI
MTSDEQQSPAEQPKKSQRVYRTEAIAVTWDASVCINSHNCVNALPQVFQPKARPWVQIDAASADEIAWAVARCPSGALHFERLDGGAQEEVSQETTVSPQPNGPLYVRGRMRILNADGALLREDYRMALCRCGQSNKKPFCDGSHRTAGFEAD